MFLCLFPRLSSDSEEFVLNFHTKFYSSTRYKVHLITIANSQWNIATAWPHFFFYLGICWRSILAWRNKMFHYLDPMHQICAHSRVTLLNQLIKLLLFWVTLERKRNSFKNYVSESRTVINLISRRINMFSTLNRMLYSTLASLERWEKDHFYN